MTLADLAGRAAEEIRAAVAGVDEAAMNALVLALSGAGGIACYGVGREGLMMRAPRDAALPHGP